jgi:putative SOS response-associated peptidase YedK
MCYTIKQTANERLLEGRFRARVKYPPQLEQIEKSSGFAFPLVPVITNKEADSIQLFHWGLIPHWAKDMEIRKNTLNARIETIEEKPSFRSYTRNRCLVLIDGFYEYQWQDTKGKVKKPFLMTMPDLEPFALGGLFSIWTDTTTGELMPTFTILTMEANEQMAIIHNTKKRMPLILTKENEMDWLEGKIENVKFEENLVTTEIV